MAGNMQARQRMLPMSHFKQEVLVNIVDSFKTIVKNFKNDIHSISKKKKHGVK